MVSGIPDDVSGDGARRKLLALAGYLCLFAAGFCDNARGPLVPLIKATFAASSTESSLLLWIGSLAGLPGSLLAGAMIARRGPRATLRFMAFTLGAGLLIVARAGVTKTFFLVPAGAGVLGVGLAGLGVLANYYVTVATAEATRAAALARLHVTYAVASILVPQLVCRGAAIWPWPGILAAVAAVPLLLVPGSFAVPDGPVPPTSSPTSSSPTSSRGGAGSSFRLVLAYALAISLFVVAEVSVSAWLVPYATERTTYGPEARSHLASAFFVGLGLARGLGGAFLRPERVRPAIVLGALASAAIVLLGLHVSALLLPGLGFTVGILFPATVSLLTFELPAAEHGRAIGIVSGAYSFALALAHAAVGKVADASHLGVALHLSPACAVLGTVVLAFAWRNRVTSPLIGGLPT